MPTVDGTGPLSSDDVRDVLRALAELGRDVAIAVSGGVDSVALMRLVAMERDGDRSRTGRVFVFTVDHGLRAEAQEETAKVVAWSAALGMESRVLRLGLAAGTKAADVRRARYEALTDACRDEAIEVLLTAHTRDDQAETVLINMQRGSGLWGLTGIPRSRVFNGVCLHRPLLDVPKGRLQATCEALGQDWVEDPTNADTGTRRGAARSALPMLVDAGLTADALCRTAANLAGPRQVLDRAVAERLFAALKRREGYVLVQSTLLRADAAVAQRAMGQLLAAVGGQDNAPRGLPVLDILAWLKRGEPGRRTLHGCVVSGPEGSSNASDAGADSGWKGAFAIHREPGRTGLPVLELMAGQTATWDGRYRIRALADVRIGACEDAEPDRPLSAQATAREAARAEPGWWDGTAFRPLLSEHYHQLRRMRNDETVSPPAYVLTDFVEERLGTLRQGWGDEHAWARLGGSS